MDKDINIFSEIYYRLLNTLGPTISAWFWGLLLALVLGHFVTSWFVGFIRAQGHIQIPIRVQKSMEEKRGVHPGIVGPVERLFFMFLIAYDVSGTATAMIAWIAVKMLQKWGRSYEDKNYAFSRLMGGLISMLFALFGGLLVRYLGP